MAQWKRIRLVSLRMRVQSLASLSGLRIWPRAVVYVGRRRGSDPALLWLWCRPGAVALIRPLVWEFPYAIGTFLKKKKKEKKRKKEKEEIKLNKNKGKTLGTCKFSILGVL